MPSRAGHACNDLAMTDWSALDTVLCDLDGVIWLAHRPIPGAVDAVGRLRASGRRVVFVTNNGSARRADHEAALAAIGIDATGDVVSSAMAAAQLVQSGARILVTAGAGVVEAFAERGATVVVNDGAVSPTGFDAVVVGMHREFDYDRLVVAASAVRGGAVLIGTNPDPTYPTPAGLLPGGGALLAAVSTASEATPVVAGKPHAPMAELIVSLLGAPGRPFLPGATLMVGDRAETDGRLAARLGCRFALVRSGVPVAAGTRQGGRAPALDAADLAAVADVIVSGGRANG
jgi:4-nitrophenyl phosphatase